MEIIPKLKANDIEIRVQSISKSKNNSVGAVLLLYKNARVDMRILDQVFGVNNWQRTHEVINGNLFCNIDIWDENKKMWVRKQDVGTESNTEKEKGEASDSFKRAGFNLGIGRELYTAPFIYITLNANEYYSSNSNGKEVYKLSIGTKFNVSRIGYNDRREITELEIVDNKGNVRYTLNNKSAGKNKPAEQKNVFITAEERGEIDHLISITGTDKTVLLNYYKIESLEQMNRESYNHAKRNLQKKMEA